MSCCLLVCRCFFRCFWVLDWWFCDRNPETLTVFRAFTFGSVTLYRQPLEHWLGLSFFNTLKKGRKSVHDIIDITDTYPTRQEWGHGQSPGQERENRTSSLTDDDTSTAPWDSTVCFLKFMDWLQKVSIMSHVILLLVDWSWFIQSDSKLADFLLFLYVPLKKHMVRTCGFHEAWHQETFETYTNTTKIGEEGGGRVLLSFPYSLARPVVEQKGIRKDRIQYDNIWYMLYILPETSNKATWKYGGFW